MPRTEVRKLSCRLTRRAAVGRPWGVGKQGEIDNVVELTPWDMTARGARHRHRAHELVERADADALIRSLDPLEAYYAMKELGPDDAAPFLAVIEPEQITALLDIEVWHAEEYDLDDLLIWFDAFREVGILRLQAASKALDTEALAALFRRRLMITAAPIEDDPSELPEWCRNPPEAILPIVRTPDRRFLIAARTEDELAALEGRAEPLDEEARKAILRLVDDLYRDEDFDRVASVLRSAETDLTSALQEDALRFRNARLEDLGFPPMHRAIEVYALREPSVLGAADTQSIEGADLRLPGTYVEVMEDGLLQVALRRVQDPEAVRAIESTLVPLANAACVADRVEPGNADGVRRVLERTRGYLELAITHGAGDADRLTIAADRLERHHVRVLFGVGWTITNRLGGRARALVASQAFARDGDPLGLLDDAERAVVEALTERRPEFCEGAFDGVAGRRRVRPFRSHEDIATASAIVDGLAAASSLAARLGDAQVPDGPSVAPPPEEHTLGLLLATLASRWLIDEAVSIEPLDAEALARLRGALAQDPDFAGAAAAIASAAQVDGADYLAVRLEHAVGRVRESLADLGGSEAIDPRFVDGVLRKVGR